MLHDVTAIGDFLLPADAGVKSQELCGEALASAEASIPGRLAHKGQEHVCVRCSASGALLHADLNALLVGLMFLALGNQVDNPARLVASCAAHALDVPDRGGV